MAALILLGLVAITALALWLVRREPTRQVAGWTVRGEPLPGEAEYLARLSDYLRDSPLFAPLDLRELAEIEFVEAVWTPSSPTCSTAGSIETRTPWPWIEEHAIVVSRVDRNGVPWPHVRDSAVAHEILLHYASELLGRGSNAAHDDPELARALREFERVS